MSPSALQTPMMRQYLAIKAQHPDAIVFYRMGDFYEMFLTDAETAAPLLDIALTTRDRGKPDAVPMCGVPVHSADAYIKRLADAGRKVAICEQVEPASAGGGRRLLRREVIEVITPGLVGDPEGLDARCEIGLAALARSPDGRAVGLAVLDASTADFRATVIEADGSTGRLPSAVLEELRRIAPREVLVESSSMEAVASQVVDSLGAAIPTALDARAFDPAAAPAAPEGFDAGARDAATCAAAAILSYLDANQPFALRQVARLRVYRLSDSMTVDAATRGHLELFESSEDRSRSGTLIERLDQTSTPLGARRLARWLAYPLLDPDRIVQRQDALAALADRDRARGRLRSALSAVRDLERLLAKAARPAAGPRDLVALRLSLEALPKVVAALEGESLELLPSDDARLPAALPLPEPVPEPAELIALALVDDPPVIPKGSRGAGEVGYVREGFRPELDELRGAARKGREWIARLESQERERTGIANLKVRFHPVHGYSLEIGKSQLHRIPEHYERKQTLANSERFSTAELRQAEQSVIGASERAATLEREIAEGVRQSVLESAPRIRRAAEAVAELDALAALAEASRRGGWVRPEVDTGTRLEIVAGRHPVVEALLRQGREEFVPNDTFLDPESAQLLVLTGPNMSGKSTYLRQVALIVLLAQMGSFVPAESARIGVVDRLFTRVGASDRLARGESTFMVEMRETSEILHQASPRSLVILDEIGRGTSTFDGLSIAWAVAEYLHDTPGLRPRTLFATHYHELSDLARTKARVRNAHFEVREWGEEILFLRGLAAGAANRSYGIQVARLAGLPESVVVRAREILRNLEGGELDENGRPRLAVQASPVASEVPARDTQLGLFAGAEDPGSGRAAREVLENLRSLDLDRTTPLDALVTLQRWIERLGEDESP